MHNVVCIKWGDKFDVGYVNKLHAGVKRNSTVEIVFHCFTDNSIGLNPEIVSHPLPYKNVEGWLQKLYLFSGGLPIDGRILFIDLDTLITGNIDHYLTCDKEFVVLRDLWAKADNVGSALMSFEVGKHTQIWDTFIKDPVAAVNSLRPHGDQRWVQKHQQKRTYWQDIFPNEIVSFKSECRNGIPNNKIRIICFHGKPSIKESINTTTNVQRLIITPQKWVVEYWNTNEKTENKK